MSLGSRFAFLSISKKIFLSAVTLLGRIIPFHSILHFYIISIDTTQLSNRAL
jgi:hypothetical protein